jgi:hypothetical protein
MRARRNNQAARAGLRKRRDAALDLVSVAHADRTQLYRQWRRGRLDRGELAHSGGERDICANERNFGRAA